MNCRCFTFLELINSSFAFCFSQMSSCCAVKFLARSQTRKTNCFHFPQENIIDRRALVEGERERETTKHQIGHDYGQQHLNFETMTPFVMETEFNYRKTLISHLIPPTLFLSLSLIPPLTPSNSIQLN